MNTITNREIASVLDHIADYLETKEENPYRVRAYHKGTEGLTSIQGRGEETSANATSC